MQGLLKISRMRVKRQVMTDRMTQLQRSRCMARIRSKSTGPERRIQEIVSSLGVVCRRNVKSLPGSPDLVFRSLCKVIFVHGCFWHRHRCPKAYSPKAHAKYWMNKFARNIARDRENGLALRRQGWEVLIIWECQLRREAFLIARLKAFLWGRSNHTLPCTRKPVRKVAGFK